MYFFVKRVLDVIFGIVFFIVLFPVTVIVALILKGSVREKLFYFQKRIGRKQVPFVMVKFTTMKNIPGTDRERTTAVSRFIRQLGLDEIPQLWNIIKGDMSFIGPRPFIVGEKLPSEPDAKIYTVRPGVTGLAQARGRRLISHQKRLEYDIDYVEHLSFFLDVSIFCETFVTIIKQACKR